MESEQKEAGAAAAETDIFATPKHWGREKRPTSPPTIEAPAEMKSRVYLFNPREERIAKAYCE